MQLKKPEVLGFPMQGIFDMKIGDLVQYDVRPELGLIIEFDCDGDPMIQFYEPSMASAAYLIEDIRVINASR